jgi:subtilisin family serine protease
VDGANEAQAILYATDVWKVKIISLSIGFRKAFLGDTEKAIVRNAIDYARKAEVLIFAAASNEGNRDRILFPASEPESFCIHSSNGYGVSSEFNPPPQPERENFSILGEGVRSTTLQSESQPDEAGRVKATWAVRRGTSVATPIAAAVAAIVIHFGRQWEPDGHEKLETRRGIKRILKSMTTRNDARFYDIVPWHGVFELSAQDLRDPVGAATERIERELRAEY